MSAPHPSPLTPSPVGPKIVSLGCRLNAYEGEAMKRIAAEAGLADAIVVNSCAVTNEAVRQSRQTIRRLRRENAGARLIVTGCAAQIDPAAFAAMDEVDAVLGNMEKLSASEWRAIASGGEPVRVDDIFAARETAAPLLDGYGDRSRAFLQVQNGCDHRCTFCIIPFGRGASRSSPADRVIDEARRLVAFGRKELVLTGVDITSWGADLPGAPKLGELVGALLDTVAGLERLRLSSIDGAEVDDALFDRIAGDKRLAPHLHISLQHGDDLILKRMKRRHTRAQAIAFCDRLRARRPDLAFGADIIAGFPTETEAMFENSLSIVDEAGIQYLHVFPFSPRAGTPAARMPLLDSAVVKARAERLRAKGAQALTCFLNSLIGRDFDAVLESGGRARLGNFAPIAVDHDGPPGAIRRLRITGREGATLLGAAA